LLPLVLSIILLYFLSSLILLRGVSDLGYFEVSYYLISLIFTSVVVVFKTIDLAGIDLVTQAFPIMLFSAYYGSSA
jgi:hypothetical protein